MSERRRENSLNASDHERSYDVLLWFAYYGNTVCWGNGVLHGESSLGGFGLKHSQTADLLYDNVSYDGGSQANVYSCCSSRRGHKYIYNDARLAKRKDAYSC